MPKIHITLQGKGGCGKSTSAAMMAQYLISEKKIQPLCIDVDPLNHSFSSYKAFNARVINALGIHNFELASWDALLTQLVNTQSDAIVDVGANGFTSLLEYMLYMDMLDTLAQKHTVYIHIPIAGSEALIHTVGGMAKIIDNFKGYSQTAFIVWLHHFWGPIEQEGSQFEQFPEYVERKALIKAVIKIAKFPKMHEDELRKLLSANLTLDEGLECVNVSPSSDDENSAFSDTRNDNFVEQKSKHGFSLAQLQRITQVKRSIFKTLHEVGIFD